VGRRWIKFSVGWDQPSPLIGKEAFRATGESTAPLKRP